MASYFEQVFDTGYLVEGFKALCPNADLLVGTGVSGTLAIGALRAVLGTRVAAVRKPGVSCHQGHPVSGQVRNGDSWIFVDDMLDSGATLRRVKEAMHEYRGVGEFLGAYLYQYRGGRCFIPANRLSDSPMYGVRKLGTYETLAVDGTYQDEPRFPNQDLPDIPFTLLYPTWDQADHVTKDGEFVSVYSPYDLNKA